MFKEIAKVFEYAHKTNITTVIHLHTIECRERNTLNDILLLFRFTAIFLADYKLHTIWVFKAIPKNF